MRFFVKPQGLEFPRIQLQGTGVRMMNNEICWPNFNKEKPDLLFMINND